MDDGSKAEYTTTEIEDGTVERDNSVKLMRSCTGVI